MPDKISCGNCEQLFEVVTATCPNCGSRRKNYFITSEAKIGISATASGTFTRDKIIVNPWYIAFTWLGTVGSLGITFLTSDHAVSLIIGIPLSVLIFLFGLRATLRTITIIKI